MRKPILCFLLVFLTAIPWVRNTSRAQYPGSTAGLYTGRTMYKEVDMAETTYFDSIYRISPDEIAIPHFASTSSILRREGFTIGYDRVNYQARWVAYMITKQELDGHSKRSSHFYPEPEVAGYSATDSDYRKSGFDRGHLAPAADMAWSERSMRESFSYANVSPQKPAFNRGIWKKLEEQVRNWSREFDTIWVVTGPVFDSINNNRLNNRITIPTHFYKALLSHHRQHWQAIAFLMPNQGSTDPVQQYTLSVRRLEKVTRIDFFHLLPDSVENAVEENCSIDRWVKN